MPARIPGFDAVSSSAGAYGLGGMGSRERDLGMQMADAALRAEARSRGAALQADATRYAGQRMADATMFGSIVGAVGQIAAPIAGGFASGAFNSGRPSNAQLADQFTRNESSVKGSYQMPQYSKPITWGDSPW